MGARCATTIGVTRAAWAGAGAHSDQSRGARPRRRSGVPHRADAGRCGAVRAARRGAAGPMDSDWHSRRRRVVRTRRRADPAWTSPLASIRRRAKRAALTNREGEPIQLPASHALDDRLRDRRAGRHGARHPARGRRGSARRTAGVRSAHHADTGTERRHRSPSLFTGHRFSRGFAFVPQNTPTNNSVAGGSGLAVAQPSASTPHSILERRPRAFSVRRRVERCDRCARVRHCTRRCLRPFPRRARPPISPRSRRDSSPKRPARCRRVLWQVTLGSGARRLLLLSDSRGQRVREILPPARACRRTGPGRYASDVSRTACFR